MVKMAILNCSFVFQRMNLKLYAVVVCLVHLFLEGSAAPPDLTNIAEVDNQAGDITPYSLPRYIRLYSETGFNLVINHNNVGASRRSLVNKYEIVEIRSAGIGLASIIGAASNTYLAMNGEGDVYSSPEYTLECAFEENVTDDFFRTFRSHKYREEGWYLAIDRGGNVRKGSGGRKTHFIALEIKPWTLDITRL